jgi:nicotinate-nucleotide pyrophosphorylase (carboxylating)
MSQDNFSVKLPPEQFDIFCTSALGVSPGRVRNDLNRWLDEDHGAGDVTLFSAFLRSVSFGRPVPRSPEGEGGESFAPVHFSIIAKEDFVLAGLPLMAEVFRLTAGSASLELFSHFKDQDFIPKGSAVLTGTGPAASILLAERVALNLVSRLCGITTKTKKLVVEIESYNPQVTLVETRKTTPGLRLYEKYAIRAAGTRNHRHGLDSGAMLKENHLRVLGGVGPALERLQQNVPLLTKVEIEVTTLEEFETALKYKPDVIMLDHFDVSMTVQAVLQRNKKSPHTKIEVSGNLDQENIEGFAKSGVDYLSMGALIHKAHWVDMSLQITSTF